MCYIERNPVKAKVTRVAWTYPWSSAAFHVGKRDNDMLIPDRYKALGAPERWKEQLKSQPVHQELFRKRTLSGRPLW